MSNRRVDLHLLKAVINVARQNCGRSEWDEIEPSLAAAWEDLRDEETPGWNAVRDEIRATCREANLLG